MGHELMVHYTSFWFIFLETLLNPTPATRAPKEGSHHAPKPNALYFFLFILKYIILNIYHITIHSHTHTITRPTHFLK